MTSADCPTCGGEFHTVKMREEAMEYALSALGEETYEDLCTGCRKVTRRASMPYFESSGFEGVVAET
ncbi:MAG: hypothetical protein U5J64_03745 [Halobacteriales archaeon]|nr:hypothetical protein [Halobacteriales archaeon]